MGGQKDGVKDWSSFPDICWCQSFCCLFTSHIIFGFISYIKHYNCFLLFFSFLFPMTYVLHFIISYSCQKSLNIFCFQVTLPSVLQRQTLLPRLVSSPSFSQQKRLLNIVVVYSKQIFPPGLSSFSGKVVKVFIETVGGSDDRGSIPILAEKPLGSAGWQV